MHDSTILNQDAYEIILGACQQGNIAVDEVNLLAELQRDAMALISWERKALAARLGCTGSIRKDLGLGRSGLKMIGSILRCILTWFNCGLQSFGLWNIR